MKIVTPPHLEAKGYVSLWLGNFISEIDFENYMGLETKQFMLDFGLDVTSYYAEGPSPEIVIEQQGNINNVAEVQHVRAIIEWFSWSKQWIDLAAKAADAAGWSTATTGYALFNMKYDPVLARPNVTPLMAFIGVFTFDSEEDDTAIKMLSN